jgi:hypothetical protein
MTHARIHDVRFVPASPRDRGTGLMGFVSCEIGLLRVHGLALRRTRSGRLALSFPCPRDRRGREHVVVRPLDDRARRVVETQVFEALGLEAAS